MKRNILTPRRSTVVSRAFRHLVDLPYQYPATRLRLFELWLRRWLALPVRLPLMWLTDGVAKLHFYLALERDIDILNRPSQGLIGFYQWIWGKDGWWHDRYNIEHWPQWLQ